MRIPLISRPSPFLARSGLWVALVATVAVFNACGGCGELPELEMPPEPTELPPETPDEPAGPEVTADVNGAKSVTTSAGEPLVIRAVALHPVADSTEAEAMILEGNGGSWTESFHVELVDGSGNAVPLQAELVASRPESASLFGDQEAALTWTVAPEHTAQLALGNYQLRVRLDSSEANGGWTGVSESDAVLLNIVTPPAMPTAEEASARMMARVDYLKLVGQEMQAKSEVESHLALWPDDVAAVMLRGDFLLNEGDAQLALEEYQRARQLIYEKDPQPMEPPEGLLERIEAARKVLWP